MRLLFTPSDEQEAGYLAWAATRPENVRVVAERFRPWRVYRLKETAQFVRVTSFDEPADGSPIECSIAVLQCVENMSPFEYGVFGVDQNSLQPADAPRRRDAMSESPLSDQEHVGGGTEWMGLMDSRGRTLEQRLFSTSMGVVHQAKCAIRRIAQKALKNGELTAQPCEVCGAAKVEMHHDDYTRPLLVRWLCTEHHRGLHRQRRKAAR